MGDVEISRKLSKLLRRTLSSTTLSNSDISEITTLISYNFPSLQTVLIRELISNFLNPSNSLTLLRLLPDSTLTPTQKATIVFFAWQHTEIFASKEEEVSIKTLIHAVNSLPKEIPHASSSPELTDPEKLQDDLKNLYKSLLEELAEIQRTSKLYENFLSIS
jgi:hypothetical protein